MNTMFRVKIIRKSGATRDEAPVPRPAGGSTDAREFLATFARERRQRARAIRLKRVGWLAMVAAVAAVGFWKLRAEATSPVLAATAAAPQIALARAPAEPQKVALDQVGAGVQTALGVAAEPAPAAQPQPAAVTADKPVVGATEGETGEVAPPETCEAHFAARHWRAAGEACTAAFEKSNEAGLALKVAHTHWARGHIRRAGTWAEQALALGTTDADAFVLVGHASRELGRKKTARTAYWRYLRAAPEGWHAPQVRAALRQLKAEADSDVSAANP